MNRPGKTWRKGTLVHARTGEPWSPQDGLDSRAMVVRVLYGKQTAMLTVSVGGRHHLLRVPR